MSMELIAIISASITLGGLILNSHYSLRRELQKQREETQAEFKAVGEEMQVKFNLVRKEINDLREEVSKLRERMAHLEGLLDGLCEAITGRRVAEEPGEYGNN